MERRYEETSVCEYPAYWTGRKARVRTAARVERLMAGREVARPCRRRQRRWVNSPPAC